MAHSPSPRVNDHAAAAWRLERWATASAKAWAVAARRSLELGHVRGARLLLQLSQAHARLFFFVFRARRARGHVHPKVSPPTSGAEGLRPLHRKQTHA